tara:strand:+ start:551 stop:721 length:171 start_codon:yes stop_codon:yes gene_type:complete
MDKELKELRNALMFFGISTPISHEEFSTQRGRYYKKLTRAVLRHRDMINKQGGQAL